MKIAARVESLSHAFGEVRALAGVSLEASQGEILGLVGPDGAGKSTLLRLWVPVLRAQAGRVEIQGVDAVANPEAVRARVGYMPQRFALYEDLTVEENISFYSELRLVSPAEIPRRKEELLRFTRLDRFTDRRAGKLSGGMKQKLGLICTLMHRPEVLFFDEPTNGVDPVSRREFWDLLRDLKKEVTIVISTPYMDEAERCDRVAMVDRGRITAVGTAEELRARVGGLVLEVVTGHPLAAREIVARASGLAPEEVMLGGGRLRLRADPDLAEAVHSALKRAGIIAEVESVAPSMEDVFTELSR